MNYISQLEIQLIQRMIDNLYAEIGSDIILEDEIKLVKENLTKTYDSKFECCSELETIYYCFSVILSEVRQKKREVTTAIFEQNPKLSQEKSVLKEKLDAEPEYAILHKEEEQLFQFIEHIQNIKNNINEYYKEDNY